MNDAQLSIDNGNEWRDCDLIVTGRITNGISLLGINFTSEDQDLPRFVDREESPIVLLVPDVSDDPLVGHLHRQGPDYLLKVIS